MRKIFLICTGLFVLFAIPESEAILLESEYQSYFGNISFLNNYQYNYEFLNGFQFSNYGNFSQSRNRRFQRYSRNADMIWELSKGYNSVFYTLHLDYISAIDKAQPDLEQYEIKKTRRHVGLELLYNPIDSLSIIGGLTYIHADDINSRYSDSSVRSDGYRSNNNIRFAREYESAYLTLDTFFNIVHLDYDFSRIYGAEVHFDLVDPIIDTELFFQRDRNKIYLLNDEIDTHIRSDYRAAVQHENRLSENITVRLGDRFQARDNRLQERRERNYLELDNSLFADTVYRWGSFLLTVGSEYRVVSRSFEDESNSREQEQRILTAGVTYALSDRDSLVFINNLKLTQTDYPASGSILDNDQRIDEKQISLHTYLRDNIKLINHFNYTRMEEVYLKAGMSANNKSTRKYNLLPTLNIALNNNLLLQQEYHLRADYDDFHFEDAIMDRMYRKYSATYSVLTGFPWVYSYYAIIPERDYFYHYYDLLLGVSYTYDTNNSGNRVGEAYEIFAENTYHTLELEMFRRIERLEFRFRPRFIWSNIRYEFNHLFELTYLLPDRNSLVTIGVSSTGNSIKEQLWRVNALVYFSF